MKTLHLHIGCGGMGSIPSSSGGEVFHSWHELRSAEAVLDDRQIRTESTGNCRKDGVKALGQSELALLKINIS